MNEHGEHRDLRGSDHRSVIPYIYGSECCIAGVGVVSSELVWSWGSIKWTCVEGGGVQSRVARGSVRALPSREAESGATGHMAVCLAPCLRLKPICRSTRSSGYRQWPPGPPRERPQTHRWGQHIFSLPGFSETSPWQLSLLVVGSARTLKTFTEKTSCS
jgi:hypothetical protein